MKDDISYDQLFVPIDGLKACANESIEYTNYSAIMTTDNALDGSVAMSDSDLAKLKMRVNLHARELLDSEIIYRSRVNCEIYGDHYGMYEDRLEVRAYIGTRRKLK